MMQSEALKGRHALITGGGTGIGLAIARALAAEGATITITGRDAARLEGLADEGLHAQAMDVRDAASVRDGCAAAIEARGPVTICVANAGIAEGMPFARMQPDFWDNMLSTNLRGAYLTIQACLPGMVEAGWGRVMAVSSIAGVRGLKGAIAYTASKHGMIGLIRGLSEEYMRAPVTFNSLCPGYVDTPIVERNATAIAQVAGLSEDEARQTMINANRHKTLIAPGEIAAAARWLCLPGSESVNGQEIKIAGGQV
jgi:NAD(P)-dependent dehydrogenase (short-subunit alcohol dehydrogenase family)